MATRRFRPRNTYGPAQPRRRGFTPWKPPTSPPPGTYDPALDASVRASGRGLLDLQQDNERDTTRATDDYQTNYGRVGEQQQQTLADILRNRTYATEDYGTATGNLARNYQNLAASQASNANAAGILDSGWAAQAQRTRAQNQQREQSALDTTQQRALTGYGLDEQRTNTAADEQRGDLTLGFQRGGEDRATTVSRAIREGSFYQADVNESKAYQAAQSGYVPPTRPANEHHVGNVTYRTLANGRTVSADGTVRTKAQLRHLLRRRGYA